MLRESKTISRIAGIHIRGGGDLLQMQFNIKRAKLVVICAQFESVLNILKVQALAATGDIRFNIGATHTTYLMFAQSISDILSGFMQEKNEENQGRK